MNRLSFSTLPCEGWTLERMLSAAKEYGFGGIELREGTAWGVAADRTQAERRRALRAFEDAGVRVTDIGSGVCFTGGPGDERQWAEFGRTVPLAGDMNAEGIRIFLGHFATRRDRPVPPIFYREIVSRLRAACDLAASRGVQLWIETHNEFATGRSLRKLLEDVERPNCAVIYDIIHPLEEGEAPEETVALLGSRCVHVHIKDGKPFDDPLEASWEYTKVGDGRVPIATIVGLLERAGYSGSYSLEWETKWRKELQVPGSEPDVVFPHYVAFMRRILPSIDRGNDG